MAAGRIVVPNLMPALDINGDPVSGAKLYFYENETTTLKSVFTSAALSVPHANPVVADAAGVFPSIFADTTAVYSIAITTAAGVPVLGLRNQDNVQASTFYGEDTVADAEAARDAAQAAQAAAEASAALIQGVQPQGQPLWAAIRAQEKDIHIFIPTDSTGDESTEWPRLLANWFASQLSTHTIKIRYWSDGSQAWGSYTTVETGSGSKTIFLDVCAVAGSNHYYLEGARERLIFNGNTRYDTIIVSYGHNTGTDSTEEIIYPVWLTFCSDLMQRQPGAGMIITLQNPRRDLAGAGAAQTARMVAAWKRVAAKLGLGVIDVYTVFSNDAAFSIAPGQPGSLYADDVHPSSLGSQLWLGCVTTAISESSPLVALGSQGPSLLLFGRENLIGNPGFAVWDPGETAPEGFTATNCTLTKDPGVAETGVYAMRCVPAGTSGRITFDLSSWLGQVRGRTLTMLARLYRPAGFSDDLPGRIALTSTNGVATSGSPSVNYASGVGEGGYRWAVVQCQVLIDAISLTGTMWCGPATTADNGEPMWFDRVGVFVGDTPAAVDVSREPAGELEEFYAEGNVGTVQNYTGTCSASGDTVTYTGGDSGDGVRGYINLRGLVANRSYVASWSLDSVDGPPANTQVYAQTAPDGFGTSVGNSSFESETLTFTASGPTMSLLLAGAAGTTGFAMSGWTVVAAYTGMTEIPLALTLARNNDGSVVDATGGAGRFSVSATPGASLYLEGEDAQGNTKTDACLFEVTLPDDYVSGRTVKVVVNAQHAGAGTVGTKTLTVTAYELTASGGMGSNLGPAAQNLSGSAASLEFSIASAGLVAGDRLLVKIEAAVQETGASSAVYARINSVEVR